MLKSIHPILLTLPTILLLSQTLKILETNTLKILLNPFNLLKPKMNSILNYYTIFGILYIQSLYILLQTPIKIYNIIFNFTIIYLFLKKDLLMSFIFLISDFKSQVNTNLRNGLLSVIFDRKLYLRSFRKLFCNFLFLIFCCVFLGFRNFYWFFVIHFYTEILKDVLIFNIKYVLSGISVEDDDIIDCSMNNNIIDCSMHNNIIDSINIDNINNRNTYIKNNVDNKKGSIIDSNNNNIIDPINNNIIDNSMYDLHENILNLIFDWRCCLNIKNNEILNKLQKKYKYLPIFKEFLKIKKTNKKFKKSEIKNLKELISNLEFINNFYKNSVYYESISVDKFKKYFLKRIKSYRLMEIFKRRIYKDIFGYRYSKEIFKSVMVLKKMDYFDEMVFTKLNKLEVEYGYYLGSNEFKK